MPIDPAEEWMSHDCDESGCIERFEAAHFLCALCNHWDRKYDADGQTAVHVCAQPANSYQTFLAGMTPEQRAEWDKCCAIFAEKFGTEATHDPA